jgi:hypothetical protein
MLRDENYSDEDTLIYVARFNMKQKYKCFALIQVTNVGKQLLNCDRM